MSFPNSVDDLIDALDKRFPEPAIGPNDTMDQIKFSAGQRSVIQHLRTWRENSLRPPTPTSKRGAGRRVSS